MALSERYVRPVWLEIDLDNLAFNIRQIRQYVGNHVKILAVVKGDAYGTGIMGILDTVTGQGIDMLGVGILDEALLLRKKTLMPVLVFGYTPFEYSELLVKYDLIQTVYCKEQAEALSLAAVKQNKKARIHIKVDTGMGRLGFLPGDEAVLAVSEIARMPNLEIDGIYTHCPYTNESSGEGADFTWAQFRQFLSFIGQLGKKGISLPIKHACNSLGIIHYRGMHLDMVRAGIILYGSYPSFQDVLLLKPVMSLKAKIGSLKTLGPGQNVSYGRTFTTARETIVATLPVGYGDGYSRLLTNKAEVLVKGQRAPLIGTICMDQCMVDVTDISGSCQIGEEAVLIGKQGDEEITVEELSRKICGFINYEYMTAIRRRVPRVYKKEGKTVQVISMAD